MFNGFEFKFGDWFHFKISIIMISLSLLMEEYKRRSSLDFEKWKLEHKHVESPK
jgi:hypothetical protein